MNDLDILRDLIKDKALAKIEEDYHAEEKRTVILKEAEGEDPYKIKLLNVPNNVIAIKADAFPAAKNIFKGSKGECKRADYVIIVNAESDNWIIYIEMKRGEIKKHRNDAVEQLKGAECFVSYCRAVGQVFWGNENFLDEANYEKRFVGIQNIGIDKRPLTPPQRSDVHDKAENMLKLNAPKSELRFNQLTGKRKP